MVQANIFNYKYMRNIVKGILESTSEKLFIVKNKDNKTYTIYITHTDKNSELDKVFISKLGYTVYSEGETVYYYDLLSKKEAELLKEICENMGYDIHIISYNDLSYLSDL